MRIVLVVGCVTLGIVQFFAIISGIHALGLHGALAGLAAFFLTCIPYLGTAAGVYGAVAGWGWPLTNALVLFVGPVAPLMGLAMALVVSQDQPA